MAAIAPSDIPVSGRKKEKAERGRRVLLAVPPSDSCLHNMERRETGSGSKLLGENPASTIHRCKVLGSQITWEVESIS